MTAAFGGAVRPAPPLRSIVKCKGELISRKDTSAASQTQALSALFWCFRRFVREKCLFYLFVPTKVGGK